MSAVTRTVYAQRRQRPHGPVHGLDVMLKGVEQFEAGDIAPAQKANHLGRGLGDQAFLDSLYSAIRPGHAISLTVSLILGA